MSKYAARSMELLQGANSIGQVVAIGDAGSARDLIDASSYGDDWKDYVVGQQDGDEMDIEIAYDPADSDHGALITTYDGGEADTFGLRHTASSFHVTFPAMVTKLARGGARDGLLHMTLTLKILNPGVEDAS